MRKTILTLVMVLMAAFTVLEVQAAPAKPAQQAMRFKSDSVAAVASDGVEKVREKINDALDDTLALGSGSTVEIGGCEGDLSPEDIKYMSDHWGEVAKQISYAFIAGLLALVALVLFFRYLNRRNKFRVMERAIENNYPLNELSLNDVNRSAIYVQQPVVTAAPQMGAAPQPGQVPVGTPLEGMTPQNPIVMTDMVNWRAMMPAIRVLGWGLFLALFGAFVCGGDDPFTFIGLALMFVGLCKGFILYKEQQALQEAWKRSQQMQSRESGKQVPPPFDEDYKEDDSTPYQPY